MTMCSVHTFGHGLCDTFVIALLSHYPGLPDYRTLRVVSDVLWLYSTLRDYLLKVTASSVE